MRLLLLLLFLVISSFGVYVLSKNFHSGKIFKTNIDTPGNKKDDGLERLNEYGSAARKFVNKHNFNSEFCFLIDMRISSGTNRFFVYDFSKKQSIDAGLVAHGSGLYDTDEITFSNTPGSNCSSLGKYRIGNSYQGKFGLAYKLHGLDDTNDKAFERFVVLHSHVCVPDDEVVIVNICESWGCPTVSPAFLKRLQALIDKSKTPVLLWIYY